MTAARDTLPAGVTRVRMVEVGSRPEAAKPARSAGEYREEPRNGVNIVIEESSTAPPGAGILAGTQRALETPLPTGAQRALTFSLLLSAVRCTVQYVLLPFVLPWIGVAWSIPPWLTLVLGGVALASLARNVRALWRVRHARRWSYLGIAGLVGIALVLFMAVDLRALLGI